jgi:hypothetical protein
VLLHRRVIGAIVVAWINAGTHSPRTQPGRPTMAASITPGTSAHVSLNHDDDHDDD